MLIFGFVHEFQKDQGGRFVVGQHTEIFLLLCVTHT